MYETPVVLEKSLFPNTSVLTLYLSLFRYIDNDLSLYSERLRH